MPKARRMGWGPCRMRARRRRTRTPPMQTVAFSGGSRLLGRLRRSREVRGDSTRPTRKDAGVRHLLRRVEDLALKRPTCPRRPRRLAAQARRHLRRRHSILTRAHSASPRPPGPGRQRSRVKPHLSLIPKLPGLTLMCPRTRQLLPIRVLVLQLPRTAPVPHRMLDTRMQVIPARVQRAARPEARPGKRALASPRHHTGLKMTKTKGSKEEEDSLQERDLFHRKAGGSTFERHLRHRSQPSCSGKIPRSAMPLRSLRASLAPLPPRASSSGTPTRPLPSSFLASLLLSSVCRVRRDSHRGGRTEWRRSRWRRTRATGSLEMSRKRRAPSESGVCSSKTGVCVRMRMRPCVCACACVNILCIYI